MRAVRVILKVITGAIYAVFAVVVLYFPFANLIAQFAREMRLSRFKSTVAMEDVLLPGLALALLYWLVMSVRRRIEPSHVIQ
jgi:hypothetical protein